VPRSQDPERRAGHHFGAIRDGPEGCGRLAAVTAGVFPIISEATVRATLGILARTVERAPASSRCDYSFGLTEAS
jgi:hypothetical protein